VIILGIDPGLNRTGFGIIKYENQNLEYIASGTIKTDAKAAFYNRIHTIVHGIKTVAEQFKPETACVEKVFVNINPQSTLLLGQARGAAIAGCAICNIETFEYTALQVKKAVTGYGHASKEQVQKMVTMILKLNKIPKPDAADALATAITHSFIIK
jgi:crossover junction endodeoxyribonuclease RuvC